jgi:hypothetical protein
MLRLNRNGQLFEYNHFKIICHYMLNMTINTVGTLNLSTLFGALFVFSAFIETLDLFFSQEIRLPFSIPC